jgi:crotonobetainyl-CoA:carnitine CoA-transferase CaiB-like acyl-CoA transferase
MPMLDGIRIVDMTSVVFGPYATQMLADMGAEVIKVEPPTGDVSRYLGKAANTRLSGSTHLTINRGKKSVILDVKQPDDAGILRNLLKTADVFVHNVRAQAIERLGFGYDTVSAIKPDIIYAHFSGFGQNGPYRDKQAYDDVIQAATGTCTLASRVDGNPKPRYIPSLIADKVAGLYGAQALLAALLHKERTGEGQRVEVPMFEAFANFMLEEHLQDATTIPALGPIGYPRQIEPNRQPFPTADGYISVVPYTDDKIVKLFNLLGAPTLLAREGYGTPLARFRNMDAIYGHIARLTAAQTTAHWMTIFHESQFPAMPVRDLGDVFDDPHLQATAFFKVRNHPTEGSFKEMQPPIRFGADANRVLGFAPNLDEHGAAIRDAYKG